MSKSKAPLRVVRAKPGKPSRRAPTEHVWTDVEREIFEKKHWRMPHRLATEDVLKAVVDDGSRNGCPTASSLLPPLAMHVWLSSPADEWTPFFAMSYRRLAALAGIDKNSVNGGLERLGDLQLLETRLGHTHRRDGGKGRLEYRLHRSLFPQKALRERFVQVPGNLVFGGHWALLPRASARHLLLVVAALDPIYDAAGLVELMEGDGREEASARTLARRRRDFGSATLAVLAEKSGMEARTVQRAVDVLTRPVENFGPLVGSVDGAAGRTFYLNRDVAESVFWHPWVMNDRAERVETAARIWSPQAERAA
jgi:hypothetical protein